MFYSSQKNRTACNSQSLGGKQRYRAFVDLWTELDRQLEKSPAVATNLLFELLLTFQKIMFPQLLKWLLILNACLWAVLLWPKVILTLIRNRSQIELPIVLALVSEFRSTARQNLTRMTHLLVASERMFGYFFKNEQYLRHRLLLKFFVLLRAKVSFAHVKYVIDGTDRFPRGSTFSSLVRVRQTLEILTSKVAQADIPWSGKKIITHRKASSSVCRSKV